MKRKMRRIVSFALVPVLISMMFWNAAIPGRAEEGDGDANDAWENESETVLAPSYGVGDTLKFGKYEQDGNAENGKEDIEWQVLSVESDRMLVISKYALDCKPFNDSYEDMTWENSSLRKWLTFFMDEAFTPEEQEKIATVTLTNDDNSYSGTPGGNNTEDRIFCLSQAELESYFGAYSYLENENTIGYNQNIICSPTQYAINNGVSTYTISEDEFNSRFTNYGYSSDVIGKTGTSWWLRSPGVKCNSACYVYEYGAAGTACCNDVDRSDIAIRPALYINLPMVFPESIILDKESAHLNIDEECTLIPCFTPADAMAMTISWTSSNPEVASVENGVVRALSEGVTTITAKTENNLTATCDVTVGDMNPISISLDKSTANLTIDEELILVATILPETITEESIIWTSSNPEVASVEDGVVKGLSVGESTITAKTMNDLTATCMVTVSSDSEEYKVGDIIKFGHYEQDGNTANGKEEIEWQVLKVLEDRILVVSKYALDGKTYNTTLEEVTWETCSLRSWLNKDFKNTAFTSEEQSRIPVMNIPNHDNPKSGSSGGNDTKDQVFCLSLEEMESFFGNYNSYDDDTGKGYNQNLICTPTQYAINNGVNKFTFNEDDYNRYKQYGYTEDIIGSCSSSWWLRSPGKPKRYYANYVMGTGCAGAGADAIMPGNDYIAVRPALYLKKSLDTIDPESISLDKSAASLAMGKEISLIPTLAPDTVTAKTITWTSSNPEIASVENGVIKAKEKGETTITAQTVNNLTATCTITVTGIVPESINLDKTTADLKIGEELTLSVTLTPDNVTEKSITWTSSNPDVASVEDGVVTALNAGETTITAKTANDLMATCKVMISGINPEFVRIDKQVATMIVGEKQALTVSFIPSDKTDKRLTWTSSNPAVASIVNGEVEAKGEGVTVITAKTINNLTSTCEITVFANPVPYRVGDFITFGKYEQDGDESNGKEDIEWQVIKAESDRVLVISKNALDYRPYNAEKTDVTWETSSLRTWMNEEFKNEAFSFEEQAKIITVNLKNANNPQYNTSGGNDTKDQIFCLSLEEMESCFGEYNTYNSTSYYGYNQNLICSPTQYVINYGANQYSYTDENYNERVKQFGYTDSVIGLNGTTWWLRSSGRGSAYACFVDYLGSAGAHVNGSVSNDYAVRPAFYLSTSVINPESINLNKTNDELTIGEELTLIPTLLPENVTEKNITWTSSNPEVASVEDGVVKALSTGETTITAKTVNDLTATCKIVVSGVNLEFIYLDKPVATMIIGEKLTFTPNIIPSDASDKTITWTSSNPEVASVNNGEVEAKGEGIAIITAKTINNMTSTCEITVFAETVSYRAGDILTFGKYEQDGNTANGKEDIEWQVLKVESDRVLVMSKYVLDSVSYYHSFKAVTWESSYLRKWLNNEFLNDAFTEEEQSKIPTVTVLNENNPYYGTEGGNDTNDQVFCLSADEVKNLIGYAWYDETEMYGYSPKLIVEPTYYATSRGVYSNRITSSDYNSYLKQYSITTDVINRRGSYWWLRSPGYNSAYACYVYRLGGAGEKTPYTSVNYNIEHGDGAVGVRPVLYINIVNPKSINLDKTAVSMKIGEETTLVANLTPEGALNNITWTSSNPEVASVEDGVIKAKEKGVATITAKTLNDLSATCTVTVSGVYPESINLDRVSAELIIDEEVTLVPTLVPENVTEKEITWTSSNPAVASVEDGVVKGLSAGETIITAKTANDLVATCEITVVSGTAFYKVGDIIKFGKYEQDDNEENGKEDIEWQILKVEYDKVFVVSKYALDCKKYNESGAATWETSSLRNWLNNEFMNTAFTEAEKAKIPIVTVINENNPYYGTLGGNDTRDQIFCLSVNEVKDLIGYAWYDESGKRGHSPDLIVEPTKYAISRGASVETITASDYNYYLKKYGITTDVIGRRGTWWRLRSPGRSDTLPCGVSYLGTAGASYPDNAYAVNFAVRPALYINLVRPKSINLDKTEVSMKIGEETTLVANLIPEDAINIITWTSSNPDVASVEEGVVKAKGKGITTITVKTPNNLTATCTITVNGINPESISLDKSTAEMEITEELTLVATFTPKNVTEKTIAWTSSNSEVASVEDGVVKAKTKGVTTITATTVNDLSATCKITVTGLNPKSISLDKSIAEMQMGEEQTLIATLLPENVTEKTITWTSNNPAVASVANGVVNAKSSGTATITAKTMNNLIARCEVIVYAGSGPYKVGDIIKFGRYEQDWNTTNGKENVAWQVLKVEENRVLVASIFVLDCVPYNTTKTDVTWETCTLRNWLNKDFMNTAFTSEEQSKIPKVTIINENNSYYGTNGGNNTKDQVFCLSVEEIQNIIGYSSYNDTVKTGYNQKLMTEPTPYAISKGAAVYTMTESDYMDYGYSQDAVGSRGTRWWLRTPGSRSTEACDVGSPGSAGPLMFDFVNDKDIGVRPVLYIKTADVYPESISLNKSNVQLALDDEITLTATLIPDDVTEDSITWTSSNSSIVSVEEGIVKAKKVGAATITAKTVNDLTATCEITVYDPMAGKVKINSTNFPDSAFRSYISSSFDTNHDDLLDEEEIKNAVNIYVYGKKINSLKGVEYLTALNELDCGGNQLTSIDLSSNINLEILKCDYNNLTKLDVSKNTKLKYLSCMYNQITEVELGKISSLENLMVAKNKISMINIGYNSMILDVYQNGRKVEKEKYTYYENTSRTRSLYVDNNTGVITNPRDYYYVEINEENFPDEVFRKNYGIFDMNFDGKFSKSELDLIKGIVEDKHGITSLKGIEYFTSITMLLCEDNYLQELDVRNNKKLWVIYARNNSINSLYLRGATDLEQLYISHNCLSEIDVRGNSKLQALVCSDNQLTELYVGANSDLVMLECMNNNIKSLDISNNPQISCLRCSGNNIKELDITANPLLQDAYKYGTKTINGDEIEYKSGNNTLVVDKDVAIWADNVVDLFDDVKTNDWYVSAVQFVYNRGIMVGTGRNFNPNKAVTREQFTQVLYKNSGSPNSTIENPFYDVKDSWYTKSVLWAKENGITSGKNKDGRLIFGVGQNISREELALMLYKYAQLQGYDVSRTERIIDGFQDSQRVSPWAKEALAWAVTHGIISGKGKKGARKSELRLDPQGNATRAECAAMIMQLIKMNDGD